MTLNPTNVSIIKRLLVGRNSRPLRAILDRLVPADLASLVGLLNNREVKLLLEALLSIGKASQMLVELPAPQIVAIFRMLDTALTLRVLKMAPEDEVAHLLATLDEIEQKDLLDQLEPAKKHRLQQLLSFPDESAGRMMYSQFFSVPIDLTVNECLEVIRKRAQEISIYYIYCVDETGTLIGVVSLRDLATTPHTTTLVHLAKRDIVTVGPETTTEEVARIVSHYDYVALPVVEQGKMIGLITIDDVVDIIQDQATANIYASAGLQEDDRVYSPARKSIRNRLPWMMLNLLLAGVASIVISLFEKTMTELIILASLNNIVAGMAGNTAIQALTVVTRGLATGDFSFISKTKGILKEVLVGLTNGVITGVAAGVMVYFWKGIPMVGVVIGISMSINAVIAAAFGSSIPLLLKRFNMDPAAGAGVLVTTLTDIFGFFSFLGLASLGLKYFA